MKFRTTIFAATIVLAAAAGFAQLSMAKADWARGPVQYFMTKDEVAQWNALDDPSKIQVGQRLRVMASEEQAKVQVAPARGAGRLEAKPLDGGASSAESTKIARLEPKPEAFARLWG